MLHAVHKLGTAIPDKAQGQKWHYIRKLTVRPLFIFSDTPLILFHSVENTAGPPGVHAACFV